MFERTVNPGSTWRLVDGEWVQLTEGDKRPEPEPTPAPEWLVELLYQHNQPDDYFGGCKNCDLWCNWSEHVAGLVWAEIERRAEAD